MRITRRGIRYTEDSWIKRHRHDLIATVIAILMLVILVLFLRWGFGADPDPVPVPVPEPQTIIDEREYIDIKSLDIEGVDPNICGLIVVECEGEDQPEQKVVQTLGGTASWYDYVLDSGWSSVGHRVCASRDFGRGTTLTVTRADTGASTTCLVTDYIKHPDRIIDLSSTAFSDLAPLHLGLVEAIITPNDY